MTEKTGHSSYTPEGWPTVTPRIVAHQAEELAAFIRQVFGATGEYRPETPCVLRIGTSVVMVSDAGVRSPTPAFLYVYVDDADEVVDIVRSAYAPLDPAIVSTLGSISRAFLGGWKRSEGLIPVLSPFRLLPDSSVARLGDLL